VGSLYDPPSGFVSRLALLFRALFLALLDVGTIVLCFDGLLGGPSFVTGIGAQMLGLPCARLWPLADHRFQRCFKQFHVVRVGSAYDDRQRDATRVDQQAALAPVFFPDPLDWPQRTAVPEVLCP
jgi:hypothetical protein